MKTMRDIDFDNMESEDPLDKVEDLAENMAVSFKFQNLSIVPEKWVISPNPYIFFNSAALWFLH